MFRVAAVKGVIAIACLLVFGIHLLWLMPAWLLGVVLAEWQHRRSVVTASARRIAASAALLVVVASISTVTSMAEVPSFILVGVAALPLINAMTSPAPIWSTWPVIQMARLGGWSYTLYAFHRPLVALVAAGLASRSAPLTGVTAVVVIYAVAVLIAALCYAAYFAGEAHTVRIRRALLGASATPARQADPLPATN
jgi:peptidoglycan/LPS O-acetylase OafA/YrhL